MEGFMEVELMVTKRDDDNRRPTDRPGEYRAICLWKMEWQSFAITAPCNDFLCILPDPEIDVVKIAVENVFEFAEIIQSCWNMWIVGH